MALRLAAAATVLLAGLAATPAAAHSLLLQSVPAADVALPSAPERLTLRFNNRVEKHLCKVRVGASGAPAHDLRIMPGEGAPDTLVAVLPPLGPGAYRVHWQVLSTDGHIVSGAFSFRLGP